MQKLQPILTPLNRLSPHLLAAIEKLLRRIPAIRRRMEAEYDTMMIDLEADLKPYRGQLPSFPRLPVQGRDQGEILAEMTDLQAKEGGHWQRGRVSGAVYHGDQDHIDFLNRVYALNSQSNPLHADVWPSAAKYEAEIVSMTAHMLGAETAYLDRGDEIVGTVSSGGTESILLAMKTYRDRAKAERGITRPELIVPTSAHAAFDKAAQYFGLKLVKIPVGPDWRADVAATQQAITPNTIALVASAPSFPHGVIDPIEELADLAQAHAIGCHVDACLGGFVLPWAEKLGYDVPPFDFRLPGVTSMSADTHKYGYAAKGTSVVLYRGLDLRRYQYYTVADWPGGLYFSPTFAGSRPGALSAAGWAALISLGEEGYLHATAMILETARYIRRTIQAMPDLQVLGDPLWVIAFAPRPGPTGEPFDIYRVLDAMSARGWSLNGLHRPAAVHIALTLRHTEPGVAQAFLADLADAVAEVKSTPADGHGMAPVYGLAGSMPLRGLVDDLLKRYVDVLYRV